MGGQFFMGKYSSYKGRVGKSAPNRVHRRFNTPIPHQKITTDASEFKYYEELKTAIEKYIKYYKE